MTLFGRQMAGTAVVAMALAVVCGAFGCELIASVDRSQIPGAGGGGGGTSSSSTTTSSSSSGGPECTTAATCPDTGNACVTRTCTAGKCGTSPVADGTVLATQVTGDCKVKQCDGAGKTKEVNDDKDVSDDGKACTDDVCTAGVPSNPPTAKGAACGNGLVCDGQGTCVGCLTAATCPGVDDDCETRTCTAGACGFTFAALGKPTSTQVPGDCKQNQCDGAGKSVSVNLNSDLPVDGNACTDDLCTAGVPSNPPTAAGAACSQMGGTVCDGKSACVQCIMAATCPGQDTECHVRTCTAGVCGVMNVAAGTLTSMQTPNDCKKNQCDGMGAIVVANDNTDLPNDSNPCTNDICTAGVPSHTPAMAGTSCGGAQVCDAAGHCGCMTATTCPGQDTECQTRTCVANICGFSFTPAGTPVMMQTSGDCKKNQCDGAGAITVGIDNTDLPNDNNTCTSDVCSAGMPSNPPVMSGAACSQMGGTLCNGLGVCVACLAASDCPGMDTDCHARTCTGGACGVANAPVGTVTSTQVLGDCKENQCDGMGGVASAVKNTDIPVDANQCTSDVCTAGVPSNPPTAAGTACNQMGGVVCSGAAVCVQCVTNSDCAGQTGGACSGNVCQAPACNDGLKNGTETDIDCGGSCANKCSIGKSCGLDGDCSSGTCTGGVCSLLNGCDMSTATDMTGGAPVTVTFANGNLTYAPKCLKVTQGTVITYNGNFSFHPLIGGVLSGGVATPAVSGPFIPVTNTGTTKDFTMTSTGTFPYYCQVHVLSNMTAVVYVVP